MCAFSNPSIFLSLKKATKNLKKKQKRVDVYNWNHDDAQETMPMIFLFNNQNPYTNTCYYSCKYYD